MLVLCVTDSVEFNESFEFMLCRRDLYIYKSFLGPIHILPGNNSELQIQSTWAKELGINHLQFRKRFLYSLDITCLKYGYCTAEKCDLSISIYYFSSSLDSLFCERVKRIVLYRTQLLHTNKAAMKITQVFYFG